MKDWDAATHLTKQEWQHTCKRMVENRAKLLIEQMSQSWGPRRFQMDRRFL